MIKKILTRVIRGAIIIGLAVLIWLLGWVIMTGLDVGANLIGNKSTAPIKVSDNTANIEKFLRLGEVPTSDPHEAGEAFQTMALNAKNSELCLSVIKKTIEVSDKTETCICDVTKQYHNEIQEKCK